MELHQLVKTALLAFAPISELRGAIPFLYLSNEPSISFMLFVAVYCIFFNALVAPFAFLFLGTFHRIFYKLNWYKKLFDRIVERTRYKITGTVEKYGYIGLAIFVAIPFPLTGAWSGALGAWILGMKPFKSILSIIIGVAIAGIVVSVVLYSGVEAFSFLYKKM